MRTCFAHLPDSLHPGESAGFVCGPTGHLLGMYDIERKGSGFESTNAFSLVAVRMNGFRQSWRRSARMDIFGLRIGTISSFSTTRLECIKGRIRCPTRSGMHMSIRTGIDSMVVFTVWFMKNKDANIDLHRVDTLTRQCLGA